MSPEAYQIPFEFSKRPDRSLIAYEFGILSPDNPDNTSRFVRRLNEEIQIRSPQDAAFHLMMNIYTPFEACDQEELWTLLLDTKNRITHEVMVYRGTVNSIYIRQAEVFKEAVRANSPSIILSHVHPSGDPSQSPEDIRFTQEAVLAGKILGIEVLDHLIIGRELWLSMKEKGVGFDQRPASLP